MILPLRAEEADGEKANPFQLTEEEQKDAEALPPIEWGSAPEIFRDSGFPQDATPLHVAEWIARTGL